MYTRFKKKKTEEEDEDDKTTYLYRTSLTRDFIIEGSERLTRRQQCTVCVLTHFQLKLAS